MARLSPEKAYMSIQPSAFTQERWFRHKLSDVTDFEVLDCAHLDFGESNVESVFLGVLRFEGVGDYFVPVVALTCDGADGPTRGGGQSSGPRIRTPKLYGTVEGGCCGKKTMLCDGAFHPSYINVALDLIGSDITVPATRGKFRFRKVCGSRAERGWKIEEIGDAYTNSVVIAERRSAFKTFRLLTPGVNPDVEVGVALATMTDFPGIARVQGEVCYIDDRGVEYSVGMLTEAVSNIGDAWELVETALDGAMKSIMAGKGANNAEYLAFNGILSRNASYQLGAAVGQLHQALASIDLTGFGVRKVNAGDIDTWRRNARLRAHRAIADIRQVSDSPFAVCGTDVAHEARRILAAEKAILYAVEGVPWGPLFDQVDAGMVMRCHGDLHLGQILVRPDGSYAILDFEGEPLASVEERRALTSPARDVAGMLRSYSYAANAALLSVKTSYEGECLCELQNLIGEWEQRVREAFLEGYYHEACAGDASLLPDSPSARSALVSYFELEKALYEVSYELNNRPDWAIIPLKGILSIMEDLGVAGDERP